MNWFHALTLVFVVGKVWGPLTTWSWWLVLAPSFISIGILLFFVVFAFVLALLKN